MTHHTTSTRDTALLIRQLKGAPATILLMMLGIGRPTGRNELAFLTTYSEHTVQKALNQLQFIGLAQQHARRNGWALTGTVHQQLLTFPTPAPQLDTELREAEPGEVQPLAHEAAPPQHAGQSVDLDTPDALPTPALEVQPLHLEAAPPQHTGQSVHLDPGASPPPADAEVHKKHLNTPNSTGEVQTLHLASSSSCLKDSSPLRKESEQQRQQQPSLTATLIDAAVSPDAAASPDARASAHATPPDPQLPPPAARPAVTRDAVLNLDEVEADADARDAVQLLTATGCPHHTASGKGARDAVQAALTGGWTGAEIYDHVADWFDYVESTQGIKHKGFFTAARIRNL